MCTCIRISTSNCCIFKKGISFQIISRNDLKTIYDSKNLSLDQDDFLFETEDIITLKDDIKLSFFNNKKRVSNKIFL